MRAAGAKTVVDFASNAAMLAGVFGLLGKGMRAIDAATLHWAEHRPDLVLLIDSGVLNLPLARRAHARGIPVVYYIAPQTWASREYRVRTLRRAVNRVACILPFEEEYFRSRGVNATFVGHPLFEWLASQSARSGVVAALRRSTGDPRADPACRCNWPSGSSSAARGGPSDWRYRRRTSRVL
jgi:lipid-A-disaccharide synthase